MRAVDFTFSYDGAIPNASDFDKRMFRVMRDWGNQFLDRLVTTRLSKPRGSSSMDGVSRRSGNLARDFLAVAEETPVGPVVSVRSHGTGDKYAGIQENGGEIKPVNAKWLWIPIAGNVTRNGVARVSPRQAIEAGGFFHKNVFFGRPVTKSSKATGQHLGGEGYKGAMFNRGDNIIPLFVLKKSVKVPARMGATSLFQSMLPLLEIGVAAEMQEAWNG